MTLLRIDASIQGPRSASSELADLVQEQWTAAHPGVPVVTRHLGADPLPADAWVNAVHGGFTPEADRSPAQQEAIALGAVLAAELKDADAAILALPLYNFGVSQHVKTWIDLVIAGAGSGNRVLEGTPVVALVTRGGAYGAGTPRDHHPVSR